ncbi:MAG: hypothetical protein IT383_01155 [Deltaproteobacteria bacterium]|nr:hypothetical protein [Deltaproteobacteria bacterium]
MHPTSALLVFTDPRDELGRADVRAHLRPDGRLVPHKLLSPGVLDASLHQRGVVVLTRDPSPVAIRTIGDLCARARETHRIAVVLRRGAAAGTWPAHPVSAIADIPEWLWIDARAAWTSFAEQYPVEYDGCAFQQVGRLRYLAGDHRTERAATSLLRFLYERFPSSVRQRIDGFVVPSWIDTGTPLRFPTLPSAAQTYAQAWMLVPDGETSQDLEIVDLGADMLDDSRPSPRMRSPDRDRVAARALANLHSVRGEFGVLHRIVDVLEPRQLGDEGEAVAPPSRRALLRHLMVALGHPPRWREARNAHSWHHELEAGGSPEDWFGGQRVKAGLEADDEGGRIVIVACDLEANRLLPPVMWRRAAVAGEVRDEEERWSLEHRRACAFGPHKPEEIDPGIVPLDGAGAPRAPFAVVRYGDRLPRGEPALLVLVGRRTALARMSAELQRDCHVAIVECPIDGTVSEAVPSFPDAAALVRKLAAFSESRTDQVFPFDPLDLARLVETATVEQKLLHEIEIEGPPADLPDVMADLARIARPNGSEPVLVHVAVSEGVVSREALVDLEKALATKNRLLFIASPRADREMAVVTVWCASRRRVPPPRRALSPGALPECP